MSSSETTKGNVSTSFEGFESLSSNFIYCPNQFFDVCLPHSSRGVVRLVAYMILETLRLRDKNGNPVEQNIAVTYRDLIKKAGISRTTIGNIIQEAIEGGFVESVQVAASKKRGQPAQTAVLKLRWDDGDQYTKAPDSFCGFYSGTGNRSPIPQSFFEYIIPSETRSIVRFVGTVLRHTVGYENQFGRRSQAPLSFVAIQRYANFSDRQQVVKAAKHAIANNYVTRVERGHYGPEDQLRKPSTYAPKWLSYAANKDIGSKSTPRMIGSKSTPGDRSNNDPSIGQKTTPGDRSKNNPIRKSVNKESLQQQTSSELVAVIELLEKQGFNSKDAAQIAVGRSLQQVEQQVQWLPYRGANKNELGMLRRAIEESWTSPPGVADAVRHKQRTEREHDDMITRSERGESDAQQKRDREERRQVLLISWLALSLPEREKIQHRLIMQATSEFHRRDLRRADLNNPPLAVLRALETTTNS